MTEGMVEGKGRRGRKRIKMMDELKIEGVYSEMKRKAKVKGEPAVYYPPGPHLIYYQIMETNQTH